MKEKCICGCNQEIPERGDMMTDGIGWMLYECVEAIRNGKISNAGYYSPDGIRVMQSDRTRKDPRINYLLQ